MKVRQQSNLIRIYDGNDELVLILTKREARELAEQLMCVCKRHKAPLEEVLNYHERNYSARWIAKKYGVSHMTISRMISAK